MSLLLTGKGGRRYEWIAPIDPADVVFAGLGLWPENGDQYRDDGPGELHAVLEGAGVDTAWNRTNDLNRWQVTGDGTGRYVRVPYSAALDVPEFTVAVWVTYYDTLRRYFWGRDTGAVRLYGLGRGGNASQLYAYMWDSAGNIWEYTSPTGVVAVGVPLHFALTFTAGAQTIYVNGQPVAAGTLPAGARTGAADATILRLVAGNTYMHGAVADPIMLSKAASPEQIAWLADPANRPVRPWRRRVLPSAGITDLGDILGRFDSPLHPAIVQGALCELS